MDLIRGLDNNDDDDLMARFCAMNYQADTTEAYKECGGTALRFYTSALDGSERAEFHVPTTFTCEERACVRARDRSLGTAISRGNKSAAINNRDAGAPRFCETNEHQRCHTTPECWHH
jgi:hypothetical protein